MSEFMTVAEIYARFESEWVLVEDPETTDSLEVTAGKVLWHSKDRDEVYRKAIELRPNRSAFLYTGKMPKDTAIVLAPMLFTESVAATSLLGRCDCVGADFMSARGPA